LFDLKQKHTLLFLMACISNRQELTAKFIREEWQILKKGKKKKEVEGFSLNLSFFFYNLK